MPTTAKLALIAWTTILTWLAVAAVVVFATPDGQVSRGALLACLFLSLTGSLTLIGYQLSYRLFSSRAYRGNLARAAQQGCLWAACIVAAAVMQMNRALTPLTGGVLIAFFALAGIILLARK